MRVQQPPSPLDRLLFWAITHSNCEVIAIIVTETVSLTDNQGHRQVCHEQPLALARMCFCQQGDLQNV